MIAQVELPLMPRPKRRGKRSTFGGDGVDEEDEGSEGSGSEGTESDVENGGGMSMRQASAFGVRPGGGGGGVVGFDGVAWWAAPAVSVVVLDEDVGVLGNDVDPLSVVALPLLHPREGASPRAASGATRVRRRRTDSPRSRHRRPSGRTWALTTCPTSTRTSQTTRSARAAAGGGTP